MVILFQLLLLLLLLLILILILPPPEELNLWMRTDRRWNRKALSRTSSDAVWPLGNASSKVSVKLESLAVDWSEGFHGDWCKHVCRWQLTVLHRFSFCRRLCCPVRRAGCDRKIWMMEPCVSATVMSQVTHLPFCHGINVRPSDRFLSDFSRPDGSLITGMLAFVTLARWGRWSHDLLLTAWYRLYMRQSVYLRSFGIDHCAARTLKWFTDVGTQSKTHSDVHCAVV